MTETPKQKFDREILRHHYSELNARRAARNMVRALRVIEEIRDHKMAVKLAHDPGYLATCCKGYLVSPDHQGLVAKLVDTRFPR